MPVPPVESIRKFALRTSSKFKETLKSKNKCFDFYMAVTIFLVTFVELLSFYLREQSVEYLDVSKHKYLVEIYPLLMQVVVFVFSLFFMAKILRYKSCIYSKIITSLYFIVQSISLLFIVFKLGVEFYDVLVYPLFLYSIIIVTLIKIIKWFFQK